MLLKEWRGHETQEENQEREKRGGVTRRAERLGIVDGKSAKEMDADEQGGPDVPAAPIAICKESQDCGKEN